MKSQLAYEYTYTFRMYMLNLMRINNQRADLKHKYDFDYARQILKRMKKVPNESLRRN